MFFFYWFLVNWTRELMQNTQSILTGLNPLWLMLISLWIRILLIFGPPNPNTCTLKKKLESEYIFFRIEGTVNQYTTRLYDKQTDPTCPLKWIPTHGEVMIIKGEMSPVLTGPLRGSPSDRPSIGALAWACTDGCRQEELEGCTEFSISWTEMSLG